MKTKLIMLDTPVIVSDDKPIEGDLIFNKFGLLHNEQVISRCTKNAEINWEDNMMINDNTKYIRDGIFKIIAGAEDLPSIDWNGLEEEFGWVDIEKIVSKHLELNHIEASDKRVGVVSELYRKAHSLNEKKFSLSDMFKCFQAGIDYEKEGGILQPDAHGYIQSLQQPEVFDIGVEMLSDSPYDPRSKTGRFEVGDTDKVVIRNNSIKILKKL